MRPRWSEPGTGRWFRIILYLAVAAMALYFAVRLTLALTRHFGAIHRAYPVNESHSPGGGDGLRSRQMTGACYILRQEDAGRMRIEGLPGKRLVR